MKQVRFLIGKPSHGFEQRFAFIYQYDCIIAVLPKADPVIMAFISANDCGELEMRVTIECAIGIDSATAVEQIPAIATSTESWTAVQSSIARALEDRLSTRDCRSSVGLEDGLVVASVAATDQVSENGGGRA